MAGHFLFLFLSLLFGGCRTSAQPEPNLQKFGFESDHMGTLFTITLYATNSAVARTAAEAAFRRVAALDEIMSDYRADSELNLLCEKSVGQPVPISTELFDVFMKTQRISEMSDGAFDVTIGPFVRLWRFSRKRKTLPTAAEIQSARAAFGWRNLRLDGERRTATLLVPNMRLDLGGIAKGYAADEALRVLRTHGIPRAMAAASGDFAVGDSPPDRPGWKIGITAIDERNNQASRMVTLHNCGISTSGDTEQAIEIEGRRYSHIVDAATGLGLTNRIQVSVIAPDATTSDGLATALCVMGVERGLALMNKTPKTAALIFTRTGETNRSFVAGQDRESVQALEAHQN